MPEALHSIYPPICPNNQLECSKIIKCHRLVIPNIKTSNMLSYVASISVNVERYLDRFDFDVKKFVE